MLNKKLKTSQKKNQKCIKISTKNFYKINQGKAVEIYKRKCYDSNLLRITLKFNLENKI